MEKQITNAVDAGDGDPVVRDLRRQMASEPGNLAVRVKLIQHFAANGSPDLALEHARLAAERFPDAVQAQVETAKAFRALGMPKEGAAALTGFLDKFPQTAADPYSWLGILQDEAGRYPEAEKAHRAALALAPRSDSAQNNLGYCLLLQDRKEEAAGYFRKALQLNPRSETARNNLGLALAGNAQEAIAHWMNVADPATAHSNMAAFLIEQKRYQDARKELDIALGYNRRHPAALRNLRLVSQMDGKPAVLPIRRVESRWTRVKSAVKKVTGA
jgi:Flp pilus assembly protein TadD